MSRKKPRAAKAEKAPTSTTAQPRRVLGRFRVLAALCLAGGMVGLFHVAGEWWARQRLLTEGIALPAEVVGYDKTITARGETTYQVTVRYQPKQSWTGDSDGLRKQFPMTEEAYKASRAGGSLTVRYMPGDPEGAALDGQANDSSWQLPISLAALGLGSVLAFFAFRKPRE